MKADDFVNKHERVVSQPKLRADLDKLEAIFNMFDASAREAGQDMQCVRPIRSGGVPKIENIGIGLAFTFGEPGPFEGLALCKHCILKAVTHLRDTANTLDDMLAEVAKHEKPL